MIQPFSTLLPNNYIKQNQTYKWKVVGGVEISIFLNTNSIIENVTFDDLALGIFDANGTEVVDATEYLMNVTVDTGYRLYIENMMLSGLTDYHTYIPKIYDTTDDTVYLWGDCFEFRSSADGLCYVQYRNSTDIFNYNYESLSTFYNKIFLDFSVTDIGSEVEREEYQEATTNDVRMDRGQFKSTITIQTQFFDDTRHRAMQALAQHDDLVINYVSYTPDPNYEVEYNRFNARYVGSLKLYDNSNNEVNSY